MGACNRCGKVHPHRPDAHNFDECLAAYGVIERYREGGLLDKQGAPGNRVHFKSYVDTALARLSALGFNTDRSVNAFSEALLPAGQTPYFIWGGGVQALCGAPLFAFLFDQRELFSSTAAF